MPEPEPTPEERAEHAYAVLWEMWEAIAQQSQTA